VDKFWLIPNLFVKAVMIWWTATNFSPLIFPCYLLLTFVWFPLASFLFTSGLFGCVMTRFVLFGLLWHTLTHTDLTHYLLLVHDSSWLMWDRLVSLCYVSTPCFTPWLTPCFSPLFHLCVSPFYCTTFLCFRFI
jgi:hypothetical protein